MLLSSAWKMKYHSRKLIIMHSVELIQVKILFTLSLDDFVFQNKTDGKKEDIVDKHAESDAISEDNKSAPWDLKDKKKAENDRMKGNSHE